MRESNKRLAMVGLVCSSELAGLIELLGFRDALNAYMTYRLEDWGKWT